MENIVVRIEGNDTRYYKLGSEHFSKLVGVSVEDKCQLIRDEGERHSVHSDNEVDLVLVDDSTCYNEIDTKELEEEIQELID